MAVTVGYSGTPLARKLGVRAGQRVTLLHAPDGWLVGELPEGVRVVRRRSTAASDVVVAFFGGLTALETAAPSLARAIVPDGALWLAWPRRAGGHHSDITDNAIRAAVLPIGLVDVKVAALSDDWSGLKTVWRKELRPGLTR
jgi:hypothetical protein